MIIGKILGRARGMSRDDWGKFLAVGLSLSFVGLIVIPNIGPFLKRDAGVEVSSEDHPVNQTARTFTPWQSFVILGVIFGTVPIVEEWLFRDKLLSYIMDKDFQYSTISAILISAGTFGFFHLFNPGTTVYSIVPPFFGGVIFSVAYVVNGLKQSIFVHVLYNELVLLLMFLPFFL